MTLVLVGKALFWRGWPSKIEVKWGPGIYAHDLHDYILCKIDFNYLQDLLISSISRIFPESIFTSFLFRVD